MNQQQNIISVAVAQTAVGTKKSDSKLINLEKHLSMIEQADQKGAKLIVFPECALTGYDFESAAECKQNALRADDEVLQRLQEEAKAREMVIITGWLEDAADDNDSLYNTVGVFEGKRRTLYRKIFLPNISADRFVLPGNLGAVTVNTALGKIGIAVCYELRFPELTRQLLQNGMQMLVVPTNWSQTATGVATSVVQARAIENGVPVIAANRCDDDSHSAYIGLSSVVRPSGEVLAKSSRGEQLLFAKIPVTDIHEGADPVKGVPRQVMLNSYQKYAGFLR